MPSLLLVSKDKLVFEAQAYRDVVCIKSIAHFGRAPKIHQRVQEYHVHKIMPLRCGMPGFCLLRICNYPVLQLEYEATPAEAL